MFYIKCITMHKVHMHAGAIRQLSYGYVYEREISHSLKHVDNPPVHRTEHTITYLMRMYLTPYSILTPFDAFEILGI